MDPILTSNDAPGGPNTKASDKKGDRSRDEDMKGDKDEDKSKKNGGRQKADILDDTSDDDSEDQIMDSDEFAKLHRQFCK